MSKNNLTEYSCSFTGAWASAVSVAGGLGACQMDNVLRATRSMELIEHRSQSHYYGSENRLG